MQTLLTLPPGYHLELAPDTSILHRPDGSIVAIFNTRGFTPEAGRQAALEDAERGPTEAVRAQPPSLETHFLGRFELLCGGTMVSLGCNRKVLAVLKYLLAKHPQPVSQDHLMGWLWPESNSRRAKWSLNSAVHTLRKLLGGCVSAASNYVVLKKGHYQLCPTLRVSTDVDVFYARYERGRGSDRAGRIAEAAHQYEASVGLYRGIYLPDDLYEDWTLIEREKLRAIYTEILDWLSLYYLQSGRYRECIDTCFRILDQDRCHEISYRRLIECNIKLGLRGEALRQYLLCREILSQDYGIAPSRDTEALLTSFMEERGRIREAPAAGYHVERNASAVAPSAARRTARKIPG